MFVALTDPQWPRYGCGYLLENLILRDTIEDYEKTARHALEDLIDLDCYCLDDP